MSLCEDERAAMVLAACYVLLEEENRKERRKVWQQKLLKRRDRGQGAENRPSTHSTASSGSEKHSTVPSPILGSSTELSITPSQKRKISDATESPRSREETPTAAVSALHKITSKSTSQDDYDIFGNFVASRLRKLGKDYSQEVEHEIVNIIFAAEKRKKLDF